MSSMRRYQMTPAPSPSLCRAAITLPWLASTTLPTTWASPIVVKPRTWISRRNATPGSIRTRRRCWISVTKSMWRSPTFVRRAFEAGDNVKGGALNSKQLAKFGDNFQGGLHKPSFHEDGLHAPMEAGGKTYDSGFHYLLECHGLGGKNEDGGYGGPLCKEPFGDECSKLAKQVLEDADKDRTLAFNNFMDPCPN